MYLPSCAVFRRDTESSGIHTSPPPPKKKNKFQKPPQISRRHKGYMKQVPHYGLTFEAPLRRLLARATLCRGFVRPRYTRVFAMSPHLLTNALNYCSLTNIGHQELMYYRKQRTETREIQRYLG